MKVIQYAFTLLELLVVVSIVVLLSSMLFTLVSVGNSEQHKSETRALLTTVGTAIGQFKHLTGSVPLPTGSQKDPLSGTWYPSENDGHWGRQQLWWRLGQEMSTQERKDARSAGLAADLLADPYQSDDYMKSKYGSTSTRVAAIQGIMNTVDNAFMETFVVRKTSKWLSGPTGDVSTSGYLSIRGLYKSWYLSIQGSIEKDLAERQYLTMQCLDNEELDGELYLQEFTIVDAWGNPLIYAAHSTVEVESLGYGSGNYYRPIESPAAGRVHITDRNNDGIIDKLDWKTSPASAALEDYNKDGTTDMNDWGSILWIARPGNGLGYFLASAGPDELFNCLFAEGVNEDNIINDLSGDS